MATGVAIVQTIAAGALVLLFATSCGQARKEPITTSLPPSDIAPLSFSGNWELAHDRHDGRFMGRSERSYRPGDTLTVIYRGEGFRLYGVCGPNGGVGTVVIPGRPSQQVSFYSPQRRAHVLIYASPRMNSGVHSAAVVVTTPPGGKRGYVNIDDVEFFGQSTLLGAQP